MGKKKFIDKKNSATFQLFARDSSDPIYDDTPGNDRVFVRVDNNQYSLDSFNESSQQHYDEEDPSSIFADAPDDVGGEERDCDNLVNVGGGFQGTAASSGLPEDVRREILELGFPDDGYNYLSHLREIKNTGGGSAFFHNTKAKLDQLPGDVKAYDASRVRVPELKNEDKNDKSIYSVAAKTFGVRVQKVMDPEVAALLDDSDLSRFGSDVEDLEEDFVVCANLPEDGEDLDEDKKLHLVGESKVVNDVNNQFGSGAGHQNNFVGEEQRVRRGLDEQFDLLECQEYGTDDEGYEYGGCIDEEVEESLADKLKNSLNGYKLDSSELDGKYKAPADLLHCDDGSKDKELIDSATDVILRCREYGKNYENNDKDVEVIIEEESSSESELWDCETIITTYSNLDNHPAKLEAPGAARKKKVIVLKGKAGLPVEYLHCSENSAEEKMKSVPNLSTELLKRKKLGLESKEEKKERKAAVKKERSAARERKKEMKYIHSLEAQRAQRTVAVAGPSSIHLT